MSATSTAALSAYNEDLLNLVQSLARSCDSTLKERLAVALDGGPSAVIRGALTTSDCRQRGIFFTGRRLRETAAGYLRLGDNSRPMIVDPACGAGDLLLAVASRLPPQSTLPRTLALWNRSLVGWDVEEPFVKMTIARLALLSMNQHPGSDHTNALRDRLFANIVSVPDALEEEWPRGITHVLMNPPFARVTAPADCQWATGKISQASLFLEKCLREAAPGTQVVAILPDVLRTGAHYERWRGRIESEGRVDHVTVYGLFDSKADVDVFILDVTKDTAISTSASWWRPAPKNMQSLGDFFNVHVGTVVPHRDPNRGEWTRFAVARDLQKWRVERSIRLRRRRYAGRTFRPPFIVVRRTSSPSENPRGIASIIVG